MANDNPDILRSNPWFETESGLVEFVVFQAKLEGIGRWSEHLALAVRSFLASEHDTAHAAANPDAEMIALSGLPADAAEWDHAWDDYEWSKDLAPIFAFGSALTMTFAAVEMLLADLCDVAEQRGPDAFGAFTGGQGAPLLERQRLYLEREAGWQMSWLASDRKQFELLRTARNRWAHSMGEGFSEQVLRELSRIMEWTDGAPRWEPMIVEAALQSVGELARVIEQGMLRAELNTG